MLSFYLESRIIKQNAALATMWFMALVFMLNLISESAAGDLSNDVPHMLPRPVHAQTVLVSDSEPHALIVAPQEGAFAEAGQKVQGIIHKTTGVMIPLCTPTEVTGKRGLLLTSKAKRKNLVYWEKVLSEGIDLNGDGVEDQAFISRGWATTPSVMFFDGSRHNALTEYEIPNGRTLGLEVVQLDDKNTAILAVNEFHLGLYSTDRAQELWRLRFDTPTAAYAVVSTDTQSLICVGKRDGLVMTLDMNGKIISRQLLSPELTAVAPIQLGKNLHLLAASDRGITILTTALEPIGFRERAASKLAVLDDMTVLAACNGKIIALEGNLK